MQSLPDRLLNAAFVLRFFGHGTDRLLFVNLDADLFFTPAPEPLLAPPQEQHWQILFSSEEPGSVASAKPVSSYLQAVQEKPKKTL